LRLLFVSVARRFLQHKMSVHFFDRLRTLNAIGRGILIQFYNIKQLLTDPARAGYLFDTNFDKVNKTLIVKFPDLPPLEKTGAEIYKNIANDLLNTFAPMYNGLIEATDFQPTALAILNETVNEVATFQMDLNPNVMEEFFDLFVIYCQVHMLAQKIEQRRIFLILHRLCYQMVYNQKEPNYDKIVRWLEAYEKPVRRLQADLRNCSPKVVQALVMLFMSYNKVRVTEQLRKENVLSITMQGASKLTQSPQTRVLLDMSKASKMYHWYIYGLLGSPEDIGNETAMNVLKSIMTEGLNAIVFRDETFFVYREYEDMFNNYKSKTVKLSKEKPTFKEGATAGFVSGPKQHQQRRIYLRQELESLLNLMKDTPGLLGPKTMLILSALSYAKEEILWVFRHRDKIPKYKYGKPEDFNDNRISELIYDLVQFQILLREKKQIIRQYWLEYLKGADRNRLRELADDKFKESCGQTMWNAVQLVLDTLSNIDPKNDIDKNFQELRSAWYKTEIVISSTGSKVPPATLSKVVEKINFIMLHTQYVDSLDELISRACSLRELWYFKKDFMEIFERAIADGPNQPTHAMAFIILLSQFPENATPYDPRERDRIGESCVAMAQRMLGKMAERIRDLLNQVASQYIVFDNYSAEQNGIFGLLEKKEGFKPDKRWQPPPKPGSESVIGLRERHKNLRLYERNLWQLLCTFNEVQQITIYNTTFTPREFVVELIEVAIKDFLSKVLLVPPERQTNPKASETILQPPTVIVRQLHIYWSVLKGIENYVDIDVTRVINQVMLSEIYSSSLGTFGGKLEWLNLKPTESPKNAIQIIATWYADYALNKIQQVGVCWAPNRRGFVSRRGLIFRAEQYGDIVELRKLCSLIGPYGVKLIDKELLSILKKSVASLKEKLKALRVDLNDVIQNYFQESKCAQIFKLIKVLDVDQAISVSITIGKVLLFRQLLLEALATVVEDRTPLLYNAVDTAFNLYGRNLFKVPDFTPMDAFALDCGVDVGIADPELKEIFLPETQGDKKLWDLLPVLYASSFVVSTYWKDALYVPSIEGHDNNVHVLTKAISDLIIHFKSLISESNSQNDIVATLLQFVEISSIFLARMARTKGDKTVKHLPSVVIFIDLFVKDCPLLSRRQVESIIPYAFFRSMWREVYTAKNIGEEQDVF
jgi:NCK-associated protein 1